jgi:hypothetical protein
MPYGRTMSELQALVTGSITGALMGASHLDIDVEPVLDDGGNYQPEVLVTGRQSGQKLRISVEEEER